MGSNSSIVISFAIAILLLLILMLLLSYNTKCTKNDRVERFEDDTRLLSYEDRFPNLKSELENTFNNKEKFFYNFLKLRKTIIYLLK